MAQSPNQIVEAVLFVQATSRKRHKPANGPLGSPGEKPVKRSGLPFGLGNAGPTG